MGDEKLLNSEGRSETPKTLSDMKIGEETAKRIDSMFKPLDQKPMTLSEATQIQKKRQKCHHSEDNCPQCRSLGRNKQIRNVNQRNAKREHTIESKRGNMMDFVFNMEQSRETLETQSEAKIAHDQFINSISAEGEAFDEEDTLDDEDQLLLEQYIEQDQLELEMMLDSLALS